MHSKRYQQVDNMSTYTTAAAKYLQRAKEHMQKALEAVANADEAPHAAPALRDLTALAAVIQIPLERERGYWEHTKKNTRPY